MRLLIREGQTAKAVMTAVSGDPRHEFWTDDQPYRSVSMAGVIGHRQVTDAYLVSLTRARDGRLATFDQGLAKLHADVVNLVPSR